MVTTRRGAAASGVQKSVLVTVGSTKFDELIKAVDSVDFTTALLAKGYGELVIQKGNGSYYPRCLLPNGESETKLDSGLTVRCFDYQPNLQDLMRGCSLIISHAGSGSVFEALTLSKPLIVVPNSALMDNHQVELAEQLATMKHLVCSTPRDLLKTLESLDVQALMPYSQGNPACLAQHINKSLGILAST